MGRIVEVRSMEQSAGIIPSQKRGVYFYEKEMVA